MILRTQLKHRWLNLDTSKFWLLSELGVTVPFEIRDNHKRCPRWIYLAQKRVDHHWVYYPVKKGYQFVPNLHLPRLKYTVEVSERIKSNWSNWVCTRTSGWPLKSSYLIGLVGLIDHNEFCFSKDELYNLLGHSTRTIPRLIEVLEELGINYDEYTVEKRKHCIISK